MRILTGLAVIFIFAMTATAKPQEPITLWPNGAPGEKRDLGPEHDTSKPGERYVGGQPVIRLSNVTVPTITVYPAPKHKATGAAVVVCPGGGYRILAMNLEGTEICDWLNSIGVTAVLLKYRVPESNAPVWLPPLQDAQRALSLTRSHAEDWHIDPDRIGILGFSAGGHLSAAASTRFNARAYDSIDNADQVSCRPDFALLIYPAYLVVKTGPQLAPELTVTSNTPPTFLIQTEDDHAAHVESSLYYYLALKNAGVPAEMHLFAKGGHGYGMRKADLPVISWPNHAEEWLRHLGVLERKKK